MNPYIKQCESCADFNDSVRKAIKKWGYCIQEKTQEWFNIKDVKFFPAIRDTYKDGFISEAPDRYYCKPCVEGFENSDAYEDLTYEEWSSIEQPIKKEQKIEGRWVVVC